VRVNKILTTAPDDLSFTDSHGNICRRNVSAYKKNLIPINDTCTLRLVCQPRYGQQHHHCGLILSLPRVL